MKTKPRSIAEMDEKDWIILRLAISFAPYHKLYRTPEFAKVAMWIYENLDTSPLITGAVEELRATIKADMAMYHEGLKLLAEKELASGEYPLLTCLAIDSGEDQ